MAEHEIVEAGGGLYLGMAEGLVWFRDPQTGSTLALEDEELSIPAVSESIRRSRAVFKEKSRSLWQPTMTRTA